MSSGDLLVGRIAVEKKLITEVELQRALELQREKFPSRPIGQILLSLGYLREDQLATLLDEQNRRMKERFSRHLAEVPQTEILFGLLAVRKGLATHEQVKNAIREQARLASLGKSYRLGQVLVMQGVLTIEQVRFLLESQRKTILICAKCKRKHLVSGYRPGEVLRCKKCDGTLIEPERLDSIEAEEVVEPQSESRVTLLGEYELIGEVSRGGMGVIYKARKQGFQRTVALKMVLDEKRSSKDEVNRLWHEAKSIARLSHPNIVSIYDLSTSNDRFFYTMEFIEGETLESLMKKRNLSLKETLNIISTVAKALNYAHSQGVFHRDIKPSNIMIEKETGRVVITDFGLAVVEEQSVRMTRTGFAMGTPAYMAPEQCQAQESPKAFDGRTDIYSLGIVLYEMLCGRPPFYSESPIDLILQKLHDPIPEPRRINSEIPPEVEAICLRCIRKNKEERYQNAQELADDIENYLSGIKTEAVGTQKNSARKIIKISLITILAMTIFVCLFLLLRSLFKS